MFAGIDIVEKIDRWSQRFIERPLKRLSNNHDANDLLQLLDEVDEITDEKTCFLFPNLKGIKCKEIKKLLTDDISIYNALKDGKNPLWKYYDIPSNRKEHIYSDFYKKINLAIDYFSKSISFDYDDIQTIANQIFQKIELPINIHGNEFLVTTTPTGGLFWTGALMRASRNSAYGNISKENFLQFPTTKLTSVLEKYRNDGELEKIKKLLVILLMNVTSTRNKSVTSAIERLGQLLEKLSHESPQSYDSIIKLINENITHDELLKLKRIPEECHFLSHKATKLINIIINPNSKEEEKKSAIKTLMRIAKKERWDERVIKRVFSSCVSDAIDAMIDIEESIDKKVIVDNMSLMGDEVLLDEDDEKLIIISDDIIESGQQVQASISTLHEFIDETWDILVVPIVMRKRKFFEKDPFLSEAISWGTQMPLSTYDEDYEYDDELIKDWEDPKMITGVIFPWGTTDSAMNEMFRIHVFKYSRFREYEKKFKRRHVIRAKRRKVVVE